MASPQPVGGAVDGGTVRHPEGDTCVATTGPGRASCGRVESHDIPGYCRLGYMAIY